MAKKGDQIIISFGSIIAVMLSYALNKSVWWAILHFFLAWIYIIYAVIFRFSDIRKLFQ